MLMIAVHVEYNKMRVNISNTLTATDGPMHTQKISPHFCDWSVIYRGDTAIFVSDDSDPRLGSTIKNDDHA